MREWRILISIYLAPLLEPAPIPASTSMLPDIIYLTFEIGRCVLRIHQGTVVE